MLRRPPRSTLFPYTTLFRSLKLDESAILPGDGYSQYVKPFRTVEDIHVQAAVLSYLMREGQRLGWPQGWIERLSALLAALGRDRKSTRLNSSHVEISYAVFC